MGILGTYGYLYFNPMVSTGSEAVTFSIPRKPGGRPITPPYIPTITPIVPENLDDISSQCYSALENYLTSHFGQPITLKGTMHVESYPNPCVYQLDVKEENSIGAPCIQVVMQACVFKGTVEGLPNYPEGCTLRARIPFMVFQPTVGGNNIQITEENIQIVENGCTKLPKNQTQTPAPSVTYTPMSTVKIEPPEILNPSASTTPNTYNNSSSSRRSFKSGSSEIVYYSSRTTRTPRVTPQTFQSQQPSSGEMQYQQPQYQPTTPVSSTQYNYNVEVTSPEEEEGLFQTIVTTIRDFLSRIFSFF